ncbi:fibronectin type III domain-containing protein [Lactococcus formosensis]|uniref:fibronectin type III domain-containing protein n=1 Tax=Lactococcus formosensis TaxID=1281486 RepID=UPI002435793A|nr:fibronectin type III domain-containing protein [Lactococcus formosensis]MDG6115429.1 fibronectin type III domain-containing protein [Lactococcus formosensis]
MKLSDVRLLIINFQWKKLSHPNAPQSVDGVINSDGSIKLDWGAVSEAQSYLIHYSGANQSDPKDAKFMGYSETNSWTLAAKDVPTLDTGDKIYLYVQSYREKGVGADDVAKAQYLHDGPFTGSAWSTVATLTKE